MSGEPDIRIKIGVSLDANAAAILSPLERGAKRARKAVEAELGAAAAGGPRKVGASAKVAASELEKIGGSAKKAGSALGGMAVDAEGKFRRLSTEIKRMPADLRIVAQEAEKAMAKMQRARARESLGVGPSGGFWGNAGGAIGIGRRAGIRVGRGAALGFGLTGAALSTAAQIGGSIAGGMGLDTDLESHVRAAEQQRLLATKISNAGHVPGTDVIHASTLLGEARGVGNATGTDATEVLQGLQAFVGKTGDLETGRNTMKDLAILSKATGSSLEDMSNAAAEVTNNLAGVEDKAGVTKSIMQAIAGQGKLGAIEMKDMAAQMAKLASASSAFKGGAAANVATMGVLAQEAKLRGGAASATQATTSVMRFASDLTKPTTLKNWRKHGLTPFTDKSETELSDPMSIIKSALENSSGAAGKAAHGGKANLEKLAQFFPNQMSMRAVKGFASVYNEAGGGTAGLKAVDEEFGRLKSAQLSNEEVNRSFAEVMKLSESNMTTFNNHLTEAAESLSGAVLPAFQAIEPTLVGWTKKLSDTLSEWSGQKDQAVDDKVAEISGKGGKDEANALLNTATTEGTRRVYSKEAVDVLKAHNIARSQAIPELQEKIGRESAEAQDAARPGALGLAGSWVRKKFDEAGGLETQEDKAARLTKQTAADKEKLATLSQEQTQANITLEMILRAVQEGTAVARSNNAPPAPRVDGGARSPAAADAPKDGDN
jgi:hypothetical protein